MEHSDRSDVMELIPDGVVRVLDVGCAQGRLGAALKRRQQCEVWGIEVDPEMARAADDVLDRVLNEDVACLTEPLEHFDCVVAADLLEHLEDPWAFLDNCRDFLDEAGVLVLSVPNARNWRVLMELAEGGFAYEHAGLLDRGHLRHFTRRQIEIMLDAAGFEIEELRGVPGPGYEEWANEGKPGGVRIGRLNVGPISEADAGEFFTYQWLVRARKVEKMEFGLTSIVIPTTDGLQWLAPAISSVLRHTPEDIEIIVVDNGSSDQTADWCRMQEITVIENAENMGFPVACNQGAAVAKGEQILFLNNDVIVTPGWLAHMLQALRGTEKVGAVGPRSNNVKGAQRLKTGYHSIHELDGWAWRWSQLRHGESFPVDFLSGFCLMVSAEALAEVGTFDEQFGIGTWEDDDLCRRLLQADWKLLVANDSYVHHHGGMSWQIAGVSMQDAMAKNYQLFQAKWQDQAAPPEASAPVTPEPDLSALRLIEGAV